MKWVRHMVASVIAGVISVYPSLLPAQGSDWIRQHYTKLETMVPMRDGTRLFTTIYSPSREGRYPILMKRTPYGVNPYGPGHFPETLGPGPVFAKDRFIFVYQDVRGCYMSQGRFVEMTPHVEQKHRTADIDESSDTFDTIAWLLANVPGNNGKVGQWGISYPGFYAAAGMIDAHPALVATSPQAPIMDWFAGDDFHRNGALWLPHLFDFISWFGQPRPGPTTRRPPFFEYGTGDGYSFFLDLGPLANVNTHYFHGRIPFWNAIMAHGTYDSFWKARDLRPHLRGIRPAVLVVGGWFDAENLFGSLQLSKVLDSQSPSTSTTLVMGPWYHGAWENDSGERLGDIEFGSPTSSPFLDDVEFPFFTHYLKDAPDPGLPRALVFQTGSNHWMRFDAWPPQRTHPSRMYFQADGGLAPALSVGSDEFISDPSHPVPFMEGARMGMPVEYMTADQRFAAKREDVLTYRTTAVGEDLAVAGPIRVHLCVSTSGTDADWVVKVIDEYPRDGGPLAGYQQLVRGEVMRGKFRQSLEEPRPFIPGLPTIVEWTLNDVCHAFRKGHRVMVQVQSSWFPLMDRNPQVFTDIYSCRAGDFKAARNRLFHSTDLPSYLEFPVLDPP